MTNNTKELLAYPTHFLATSEQYKWSGIINHEDRGKSIWFKDIASEFQSLLAQVNALTDALSGLLKDTQHEKHECGDIDCPVQIARDVLQQFKTKES